MVFSVGQMQYRHKKDAEQKIENFSQLITNVKTAKMPA